MLIRSNYELLIDILSKSSGGEVIIDNNGFIQMDEIVRDITIKVEENGGTIKPKPNTDLPEVEWAQPVIADDYTPIEGEYFYIRSVEDDNVIHLSNTDYILGKYLNRLDYSYDQINWQSASGLTDVTLNKNEKIYLKCGDIYNIEPLDGWGFVSSEKYFAVGGNYHRLLIPKALDKNEVSMNYAFKNNIAWGADMKLTKVDDYTIMAPGKYGNAAFGGNNYLYSVGVDVYEFSNGYYMCADSKLLHRIPKLKMIRGNNLSSAFSNTPNLAEVEFIQIPTNTNYGTHLFHNCGLQELKGDFTNLGSCELFSCWFWGAKNLRKYNQTINTSSGKTFDRYLNGTSSLDCTTLPTEFVVHPEASDFRYMFEGCGRESDKPLITAPILNTSNGTGFEFMFNDCPFLETIPTINLTNASSADSLMGIFEGCVSLKNITFDGSINYSLNIPSADLTYATIKSVLTAANNTNNSNSKILDLGGSTVVDNGGEIITLVNSCTAKGWTINNLTIN